jgi:hypothetical protein
VVEAETRAEDAEDKVRVMERRFNDTDWQTSMSNGSIKANMSSSTVSDTKSLSGKAVGDEFEVTSNEKDRLIRDLESEVEQQRQLRLADAKQVEAKAARIKDWVTNKLKELEEQNRHLRQQNAHCNDQMDLLKDRLEQLQEMGNSRKETSRSGSRTSSVLKEEQLKKNFVGEKSSKVLNNRDSGRSQDVISKYNVTTTTKSSKGLSAIKSSSIDATSGPSSQIEAIDTEHQMEIKGNHTQFNEEDPLSSVIQDLAKLTTDATRDQREISSMASKEAQNEENIDDSIGSPDSLDLEATS